MTAVIQNREEMIQHVLAKLRSIEPLERNIRIHGDTGVIVARRFADGWKFVSFQAKRVPDRPSRKL